MFYLASIQMFHFIFIVKLLAFVAHVVFKVVICSLQSSHMKLCHGKNGKHHTMENEFKTWKLVCTLVLLNVFTLHATHEFFALQVQEFH